MAATRNKVGDPAVGENQFYKVLLDQVAKLPIWAGEKPYVVLESDAFHPFYETGTHLYIAESMWDVDRNYKVISDIALHRENGRFTTDYSSIVDGIEYHLSDADAKLLQKMELDLTAEKTDLCSTYETEVGDPDFPSSQDTAHQYGYIIQKWPNPDAVPLDYPEFKKRYMQFRNKAYDYLVKTQAQENAIGTLQEIRAAIRNPKAENGARGISSGTVVTQYPGWTISPAQSTIKANLWDNPGQAISVSVSMESFSQDVVNGHVSSGGGFCVPWAAFLLFGIGGSTKTTFDWNQSITKDTKFDMKITWAGPTMVTCSPTPVAPGTWKDDSPPPTTYFHTGWYYKTALDQASANRGKDVTGYRYATPVPDCGYLSRLLISQPPEITLTFSHVDVSKVSTYFSQSTAWSVGIFGISLFGGSSSYAHSTVKSDAASQTVTVTMKSVLDVSTPPQRLTVYLLAASGVTMPK